MSDSRRYLPPVEVRQLLRRGRAVEQWLSFRIYKGFRLIKFLRIHEGRRAGYFTRLFEMYDQGNMAFVDVYEFQSYIPDESDGLKREFEDWEDALRNAISELGADSERFVDDGVIQDEYVDFLKREGVWPVMETSWPADQQDQPPMD